jgi:hypothetical protein
MKDLCLIDYAQAIDPAKPTVYLDINATLLAHAERREHFAPNLPVVEVKDESGEPSIFYLVRPSTYEFLQALIDKDYQLVACTAAGRQWQSLVLMQTGLSDYFTAIIAHEELSKLSDESLKLPRTRRWLLIDNMHHREWPTRAKLYLLWKGYQQQLELDRKAAESAMPQGSKSKKVRAPKASTMYEDYNFIRCAEWTGGHFTCGPDFPDAQDGQDDHPLTKLLHSVDSKLNRQSKRKRGART